MLALFAFEIFNFDTTRFALSSLLGEVRFAGVGWATILAIAFCGIDFAGLLRVFTPDSDDNSREATYLMAAWMLGATLNATMTWYAVALTIAENNIGNEVLSTGTLLQVVPIFVALLVWLTRILFIGALSLAGGRLLTQVGTLPPSRVPVRQHPVARQAPVRQPTQPRRETATVRPAPRHYVPRRSTEVRPAISAEPDA